MHSASASLSSAHASSVARHESAAVRRLLIGAALAVVGVFIVAPVALVFYSALEHGLGAYWHGLVSNPATLHSIKLTLIVTPAAVLLNTLFGLAAAWLIARFRFPGPHVLDHADRFAVFRFAGRGRPDVGADLRPDGLSRSVAAGNGYQSHFRAAGNHSGHHVRHAAVCGARIDSGDGSHRRRRGNGGHQLGRQRLADVLAR